MVYEVKRCKTHGCIKKDFRGGHCFYHWTRLDFENIWKLPTKKTYKNGWELKPEIHSLTPVFGSRTYWDEEIHKKVTVTFNIAHWTPTAIEACAGKKECYWFLNRGVYCKKHELVL